MKRALWFVLILATIGLGFAWAAQLLQPRGERLERLRQDRAVATGLVGHYRRLYDSTGVVAYQDSARIKQAEVEEIDEQILRLSR